MLRSRDNTKDEVVRFPFLFKELDKREDIPATRMRLSCWLHCMRDVLYAEGLAHTSPILVKPLYFRIERGTFGHIETIHGGVDSHYFQPTFNCGIHATRHVISDPNRSWHEILEFLKNGHWPMIDAKWSKVRSSRFYRLSASPLHTVVLIDYDYIKQKVLVADTRSRLTSQDHLPHFWVPLEYLLAGFELPASWLSYKVVPSKIPWQEEWRTIIEASISGMLAPHHEEAGIAGIHKYADIIRTLPSTLPSNDLRPILMSQGWNQITRHIIGDRTVFLRVLMNDLKQKRLDGHLLESAMAQIIQLWEEVAAVLYLMAEQENLDAKDNLAATLDKAAEAEASLCEQLRDYLCSAFPLQVQEV